MAPWLTGRSRTLSATGSMSVELSGGEYPQLGPFPPIVNVKITEFDFPLSIYNAAIRVTTSDGTGYDPGPSEGWIQTISDSDIGSSAGPTTWYVPPPQNHPGTDGRYDISVGSTWSVSVSVQEWASVYQPTAVTPIGGVPTYYPNYGGTAYADGLPALGIIFYELTVPGSTKSVSVTTNGTTTSLSGAITGGTGTGYGPSYNGWVSLATTNNSKISTGMSWSDSLGSAIPGGGPWVNYWSNGVQACTVNLTAGATLTCQTPGGSGLPATVGVQAAYAWNEPISYNLGARLRCFGSAYPASAYLGVHDGLGGSNVLLSPSGTYSWQQQSYSYAAYLNSPSAQYSGGVSQQNPVSSFLLTSGLTANGDDSRDWRTQFVGYSWDALSLSRVNSLVIDPCTATTNWTAGANSMLSIVSGFLNIAALGGTGSATLAVPSAVQIWEAFRYLQVQGYLTIAPYSGSQAYVPGDLVSNGGNDYECKANTTGNAPPNATYWITYTASFPYPITATIAGQTWSFEVQDSDGPFLLDLCCSDSETQTVNNTQTRFPLSSVGGYPNADPPTNQYELGWGVNFDSSLIIGGIPSGMVLTLDSPGIELTVSTDAQAQQQITCLPPFETWPLGWTSASSHTYLNPFIYVETYYRLSDIAVGFAHVVPISNPSADSYVYYAISDVKTLLNYLPGITATALGTPTDGYHNDALPALNLAGGGATYNWATSVWTDWIDQPFASTIPAQDLWDEVQVYPGAGQVWTSGLYNIPTPLQLTKFLRGEAWGQGFKSTDVPYTGASVNSYQTSPPSPGDGMGTTGNLAQYLTGTPWGKGNVDVTTKFLGGVSPYPSTHSTWQNRQRTRASFRAPAVGALPHGYDVSAGQRHCRTYISTSTGNFVLGASSNLVPWTWNDVDSGIAATWARPRFADLGTQYPIGVFYGDGANCYWARTYDEGNTFKDTTDMAAGAIGDFDEDDNGIRWFFKVLSSDGGSTFDIWNKIVDKQLNVIQDWTITELTGVDDTLCAVRCSTGTDGSKRVGVFYSLSGAPTAKYAYNGLVFA
jgi:hypothetical protein